MRPTIAAVVLVLMATPGRANDKEARATLDRAITALGGAKNLAGASAFTLKAKGSVEVNNQRLDVAGEWALCGPERYRWETDFTNQGQTNRIVIAGTGSKLWLVGNNGQANDIPADIGIAFHTSLRSLRLLQNPSVLTGKNFTLTSLGELKVEQREAIGIKISEKGFPDIDAFFDKKTGLPLRCETRIKEGKDGMDVAHAFLFDDFKAAGEIKHCTRLRFLRDQTTHFDLELSEVKSQEKLDDSYFTKPPKP